MKIAFFSSQPYDEQFFILHNASEGHELTFFTAQLTNLTAGLAKGYDAVCVFVNDVLNEEVIKILTENGVKIIALRCAGFNNVDLKAASVAGIKVVRVPAYSPHAVAEHAVALLLTLNRKTHKAYNRVRESDFSLNGLMGFDLYKKKVGVVGTGEIGRAFLRIMLGFGCEVMAYDPFPNKEVEALGVKYYSLQEILAQADIVSLHCPLNDSTRHLINEQSLAKMKQGVYIINTGRGALINSKDTIIGLKSGRIGGLAMDVYEQEDQLFFHDLSGQIILDDVISRLLTFPNVIITGHQGFFTIEALTQIALVTLANLKAFKNGEILKNEVVFK
jgi:D-lactate dehydrogenase